MDSKVPSTKNLKDSKCLQPLQDEMNEIGSQKSLNMKFEVV